MKRNTGLKWINQKIAFEKTIDLEYYDMFFKWLQLSSNPEPLSS